jgi:hypothetical protein
LGILTNAEAEQFIKALHRIQTIEVLLFEFLNVRAPIEIENALNGASPVLVTK